MSLLPTAFLRFCCQNSSSSSSSSRSVFFDDVQFHRIEPNYFELNTTFFTGNTFAFIHVHIYVNIRITLGTCSSRHRSTSNKI